MSDLLLMKKRNRIERGPAYGAILFDYDGVLADTMEDNYAAWADAFSVYGITLKREEYFLLEGMDVKSVAGKILSRRCADEGLASAVSALKENNYRAGHRFRLYPGVTEIIESLKQRYALGLVTGATRSRLRESVPDDLRAAFGAVITGDDVRLSKPHPEPYLKAAISLGIEPQHCLVVENAPLGITAAKNAGMVCVALCTTLASHFLQHADVVIDNIHHLDSVLKAGN
jgi:beta-phosphoglucomutase